MKKEPPCPRPLLDRALERLGAAASGLSEILLKIEVSPEIPSRTERRPLARRRDGLDAFHPDHRGVVAFIPGRGPLLVPPEDPVLHRRLQQAQKEIATWGRVVEEVAENAPPKLRKRLQNTIRSLARWSQLGSEGPPAIPIGLPLDNADEVRRLAAGRGMVEGATRA